MLSFLYVYSDHSILECYNLFSGVELSMRSFFVIWGRGTIELERTVWLLSTPACAEVNQAMQEVTNVTYEASKQHKETSQRNFTSTPSKRFQRLPKDLIVCDSKKPI